MLILYFIYIFIISLLYHLVTRMHVHVCKIAVLFSDNNVKFNNIKLYNLKFNSIDIILNA